MSHPGDDDSALDGSSRAGGARLRGLFAFACAAGAVALVLLVDPAAGPAAAGAYFGAGTLALVAGLLILRNRWLAARTKESGRIATVAALGVRNSVRRPGRSLTTITLMAIGSFLVLAIGANRQGPTPERLGRDSGTGGFALFGRSSLAVLRDLGTERGRESFGIDEDELAGVGFVPLRVREGDDASCLNLSRVARPRLLGVVAEELAERDAFVFTDHVELEPGEHPWDLLDRTLADGEIPAIGDATSLTWQLHLGIGDTIEYADERGRPFRVRLVGAVADSILQGNVLIGEEHFGELFPSEGGHRRFLIDVDVEADAGDARYVERVDEVSRLLSARLQDVGLSVERTTARLDGFHAVQNTYLAIFQVLGALGLLLGSVGLGMVVLRNTLERRWELALTRALGFSSPRLRWLVATEYGLLLVLGLGLGALAALVTILPAMRAPGSELSLSNAGLLAAVIALNGVLWTGLATGLAVARAPLASLCEE